MSASVDTYLATVAKAFDGRLKLPSFQRKWVWKSAQVILLFDSLRRGYPIGTFLYMNENERVPLAPRAFANASEQAETIATQTIVLNAQLTFILSPVRYRSSSEIIRRASEKSPFDDITQRSALRIWCELKWITWSGAPSPDAVDPAQFAVVQANVLDALRADLRALAKMPEAQHA